MSDELIELLPELLGASATLLAATLAAVVAAGVFVAGEVVKIWQATVDRQIMHVDRLLAAWADVASVSAPRVGRWWSGFRTYSERVDVTVGTNMLAAVLPRRDFEVITLQRVLNHELVRATSDRGRIGAAAQASAALTIWLSNRRRGRRHARWELSVRKVRTNFDGSTARSAREPRRSF